MELAKFTRLSELEFEAWVPMDIRSLNQFIGTQNSQLKPWAWRKYCEEWAKVMLTIPKTEKKELVKHTTIFSYRKKLLDKENIYGGSKPIRDGLVRKGWLYDDHPKWGDVTIWQVQSKDKEGTTIKVTLDR